MYVHIPAGAPTTLEPSTRYVDIPAGALRCRDMRGMSYSSMDIERMRMVIILRCCMGMEETGGWRTDRQREQRVSQQKV